jgi:hypothetical protein
MHSLMYSMGGFERTLLDASLLTVLALLCLILTGAVLRARRRITYQHKQSEGLLLLGIVYSVGAIASGGFAGLLWLFILWWG